MLFAVMSLFHKNIPCCKSIFRMKNRCEEQVKQKSPGSDLQRVKKTVASPKIIGVMQPDTEGSPKFEEVDAKDFLKTPSNKIESNYDRIMKLKAAKNSKLKNEEAKSIP